MNCHELALDGDRSAIERLRGSHEVLDIEIVVTSSAIAKMLRRYLDRQIVAADLQQWADFLVSNETFVCANWRDDATADRYEPMWYVLQRVATPLIDGEISVDKVSQYLHEVETLQSQH